MTQLGSLRPADVYRCSCHHHQPVNLNTHPPSAIDESLRSGPNQYAQMIIFNGFRTRLFIGNIADLAIFDFARPAQI